jgi:trehalose-phosphatase
VNGPVQALDVRHLLAARRRRGLIAIFDLDGTLAPIAPRPGAARVPQATRRALRALARRPDTIVGIVSGRPLAQVERRVGRGALWLAGLHGCTRRAPRRHVERLWSPLAARRGRALAAVLRAALAPIEGVWVEHKGPLVALHVRGAERLGANRARSVLLTMVPRGWALLEGRRVIEVRPARHPTKADAVRWIRRARRGAAVLYVGDDATDEDAFRALGPRDFAVLVDDPRAARERHRRSTQARYRVPSPGAVAHLVDQLARD